MPVEFLDTTWEFYDLHADDLTAAAQALSSMDEAGRAEWFPDSQYKTSGGRVVNASVTVRTRVTMPRWTGFATAPPRAQAEWTRFSRALRGHESGHIALVEQHLTGVDKKLVGQSVAAAQRIWAKALSQLKHASEAYDRATDHGRRHGTIINPAETD